MVQIYKGNDHNVRKQIGDLLTDMQAQIDALAGLSFLTETVTLATTPVSDGNFTIAGSGMTVGKPVMVMHYSGPLGELDGDKCTAVGVVESATVIRVYWQAPHRMVGSHTFKYQVGA